MGFGAKKQVNRVSMDRLAAVSGGGAAVASGGAAPRRVSVEPDLSRMRKSRIEETPEERKKRLAAKTVNFGATIIARIVIFIGAGMYGWEIYEATYAVPRGVVIGMVAMLGDFCRVLIKMMEPGSK